MFLIDSIGLFLQSAVTLYIYRVGWTYPVRNPVYRSKPMKNPSCTRTLPGPVTPVGPCRTATVPRPVRPLGQTGWCQFWLSTYAPLFFSKACLPKNILLSQNCLRAMINTTSTIFCTKGDKQLSAMFCSSRC